MTPAPPQPSTLLGIPLTGTVDSQFDAGYFVTIHAGTQEFKGENYICPGAHLASHSADTHALSMKGSAMQ